MKATCENCRFWNDVREHGPDSAGECRRYAPRPEVDRAMYNEWPGTFRGDWCGEHQPDRL